MTFSDKCWTLVMVMFSLDAWLALFNLFGWLPV